MGRTPEARTDPIRRMIYKTQPNGVASRHSDLPTLDDGAVRVVVWVRPGASRTVVGGSHDGALVVRVGALAVDGQATAAALQALAKALGVPRRAVLLVSGATSRTKVVNVPDASREAVALCWRDN
ncbi:MAG: DUF167 domain-containing protein [Pseudonocardiaceae bacterium]